MNRDELFRIARDMLNGNFFGTLSSLDSDGYAYGSLVRYCLDETGQPLFSLSRIAEHTGNFLAHPRVSLFLLDGDVNNIQESARLTVYGEMALVGPDEERLEHFCRFFPEARMYHEELDFDFYRLQVTRAHYVGGFARAHKIKGSAFIQANPLAATDRAGIISHMNEDHADAVSGYCTKAGLGLDGLADAPQMVGIDREGCHIRLDRRIARIPFAADVTDRISARQVLVEMAQA